jgi:hypothetical protein
MDYNQHKATQERRLEILQFRLQAWVRYMKRLDTLNRLTPEVLLWISGKMIAISREVITIGSQPIPRYPQGAKGYPPGEITRVPFYQDFDLPSEAELIEPPHRKLGFLNESEKIDPDDWANLNNKPKA